MYSPQFMRFLIGRDADDYVNEEKKQEESKSFDSVIYRCSKYATVPIEIKKHNQKYRTKVLIKKDC